MYLDGKKNVTPLAGVWIETHGAAQCTYSPTVTPLAGVWIETWIPGPIL